MWKALILIVLVNGQTLTKVETFWGAGARNTCVAYINNFYLEREQINQELILSGTAPGKSIDRLEARCILDKGRDI